MAEVETEQQKVLQSRFRVPRELPCDFTRLLDRLDSVHLKPAKR